MTNKLDGYKMQSFKLSETQIEQLRKLSYTSRKTRSSLVREAIDFLITNPPKEKHE